MCDGSSCNLPSEFETILSNCLSHGRRYFVALNVTFPEECRFVLETFLEVYVNDAYTKEHHMTDEERLRYHQLKSKEPMDKLKDWFEEQFREKRVEPNSSLGKAIKYMLKRWTQLTLFLRVPGAPLDNNLCEQMLKKAILNRKNALFYKTRNGAWVGDLFMSLIYTTELSGGNPFDYLTALLEHEEEVQSRPEDWMPWNLSESAGWAVTHTARAQLRLKPGGYPEIFSKIIRSPEG